MNAAERPSVLHARSLAHRAVTEGVNLKYVELMRRELYELADFAEAQDQELQAALAELVRTREALAAADALIVAAFRVAAVASDAHDECCEECAVGDPCALESALSMLDAERSRRAAAGSDGETPAGERPQ